jgi:hypothetical protein
VTSAKDSARRPGIPGRHGLRRRVAHSIVAQTATLSHTETPAVQRREVYRSRSSRRCPLARVVGDRGQRSRLAARDTRRNECPRPARGIVTLLATTTAVSPRFGECPRPARGIVTFFATAATSPRFGECPRPARGIVTFFATADGRQPLAAAQGDSSPAYGTNGQKYCFRARTVTIPRAGRGHLRGAEPAAVAPTVTIPRAGRGHLRGAEPAAVAPNVTIPRAGRGHLRGAEPAAVAPNATIPRPSRGH